MTIEQQVEQYKEDWGATDRSAKALNDLVRAVVEECRDCLIMPKRRASASYSRGFQSAILICKTAIRRRFEWLKP